jgi:hypothetical protein
VGFSFGEITPQHRDVFYPEGPRCVRLKLTAACEIPALSGPKIEKCETLKTRAVLYPKNGANQRTSLLREKKTQTLVAERPL